ncbi:MAG TPA: energy-coupling factor transporter transmembrane protein EcfT [Leifsonia sp.]|jgi:biotin transport system permease protein|nr:energy-coupling factor transporter transrane protein EcfT [Microbacteriaceae bacterium]HEV7812101.1 energy-coupling factor transporter transmembrane protein EcfT [Leifsonia sp.]
MLSFYRPGDGWLHRMPSGPKAFLLFAFVLGVSLLPSAWWAAAATATATALVYLLAGVGGWRELSHQILIVRWPIAITVASQLLFLGPEQAVANTVRVVAAIVLAALLVLTTRVSALLDMIERGLRPMERLGLDSQRAALLLTVTLTTIPVLARLAGDVRDAQRARGGRSSLRSFTVPFLVVALKHADELGDALTARGIR